MYYSPVFSPRIIKAMTGGRGLGVASGHIKAFGLFPFPHQKSICAEGLQGRHTLNMLGRTLVFFIVAVLRCGIAALCRIWLRACEKYVLLVCERVNILTLCITSQRTWQWIG